MYRYGEVVVDAVAGVADASTGRPVTSDTPFYATSTGKGVAATVVHVLAERGALGYDTPIAELWPEFGAHGKQATTIRHALTHSVGVPGLPADTQPEAPVGVEADERYRRHPERCFDTARRGGRRSAAQHRRRAGQGHAGATPPDRPTV